MRSDSTPFLNFHFLVFFRSHITLEPAKCPSVIVVNLPVTEITSARRSMEIFITRASRLLSFLKEKGPSIRLGPLFALA